MIILGITDGDDGGAALLVDGKLVSAVNEERLNRMKMSIGFPRLAVQEVIQLAGVEPNDVDHVAMAALAEQFCGQARVNDGWFRSESGISRIRNAVSSALSKPMARVPGAIRAYRLLKRASLGPRKSAVRSILATMGVRCPISYHDHHRCHAVAALETSGYDHALSLSLDGGGDGSCSHVYDCHGSDIRLLQSLDSFHSIGNYYAYVTHMCGFKASLHEGKITGLAAMGKPLYRDVLDRLICYRDGRIENIGRVFFHSAIRTLERLLPKEWEMADLAASVQDHLEAVVVPYVQYWLRRTGQRNICLSGGVFANVRLNQRIAELSEVDGVWVFPAMGDGGLAAGSAICQWLVHANSTDIVVRRGPLPDGRGSERGGRGSEIGRGPLPERGGRVTRQSMDHVYLGGSIDENEAERDLERAGVRYRRCGDVAMEAARLLHAGQVVARVDGAMEYGPRALGNRTVMYRCDDPTVNDWLNRKLVRTEFMPFAPACLAGHEEKLFKWNEASAKSARFMTITLDCTEYMHRTCPAVVHVDGTARPQIVDEQINPGFYEIIRHYYALSGVPVIINTSFNMHEEPIVCTPADAIRAFQKAQLDALVLGPFLVEADRARVVSPGAVRVRQVAAS